MIEIKDKTSCCGCASCVQKCPRHCISMHEDNEGFLYPRVEKSACIDCGLCEKACPMLHVGERMAPERVFAAKNPDTDKRHRSSSGGVFIALAHDIICRGGVVFGAVFDVKWEACHGYAERIEDVYPMMGSKYMQSRIGESYRLAEEFLRNGREVLFTGTPCQIAGLKIYIGKDYENLTTMDFLCHGVPSPGIWRKYLKENILSDEALMKTASENGVHLAKDMPFAITDISFRDKIKGWIGYTFVVRVKQENTDSLASMTHEIIIDNNPFMRGYLNDVYLRTSCYSCKCKNGRSKSDVTIADFWGIQELMPDFFDDKGIALVMINSGKGMECIEKLGLMKAETRLKDVIALKSNAGFSERIAIHPKRKQFFDNQEKPFLVILEQALKPTFRTVLKRYIIKVRNKIKSMQK
ncbi:MAG: Coenzyme F420 hydrogenase/dehydrogenase, beta subunit C-terminal domain [Prevotellaceae bacterium]|nr:Coenzyme F420 hydrogenase/dehydrogenase, beta subunit C-terminal domain [Prevotellaceae bacterium]